MKLKVALAQMRAEKGDWHANLQRVEELMAQARDRDCDVIIFPEMSLSGYCSDQNHMQAAQPLDSPLVQRFVDLTARYGIAASAGLIEANGTAKPFITQVLAQDGRIVGVYRKVHVVEEEAELFSPGSETPVFELPIEGGRLKCALAVCADSDRPDLFSQFAAKGAQVVFHSSAPGLYTRRTDEAGWQDGYNWYKGYVGERLPLWARDNRLPIVVATQCGATVDEDFPGGSFVFGSDGTCLAATPDYRETLLIHELEIGD